MWEEVIEFWFHQCTSQQHFGKDQGFDDQLKLRFASLYAEVSANEHWAWREQAHGALAEIIVLDQFSRNFFRHQATAFACDGHALALAQSAVKQGFAASLTPRRRAFLYMPYMHSESLRIHQQAKILFAETGLEKAQQSLIRHTEIIERFGRYPHRNAALGRQSSEQERLFLQQPGSSF